MKDKMYKVTFYNKPKLEKHKVEYVKNGIVYYKKYLNQKHAYLLQENIKDDREIWFSTKRKAVEYLINSIEDRIKEHEYRLLELKIELSKYNDILEL